MYSEVRQDEFVCHMTEGKIGTYLEIGAWKPVITNNTYLLEQNGWTGVSFDISTEYESAWKDQRKNPLIIANALTYDFKEMLSNTPHIDYLQLDIEPPKNTFEMLEKILQLKTTYSVITYETDAYVDSTYVKPSRDILQSKGYILAVSDVLCKGGPFEDWYINPEYVDVKLLQTWKR